MKEDPPFSDEALAVQRLFDLSQNDDVAEVDKRYDVAYAFSFHDVQKVDHGFQVHIVRWRQRCCLSLCLELPPLRIAIAHY
jgi:hypothetical protein